ncbi:MAG: Fe3+ ABC transporter permease [Planctomycetaceae bacterium]
MRLLRRLGRWAGAGLWFVVLAPALAVVPAAVLDRGPDGAARPTLFPAALVALDPFVREGVRNSLVVAAAVAGVSLVLGVGLARGAVGRRFWGRPILAALGIAPLAIPPVVEALGLRLAFGPLAMWPGVGPALRSGVPADLGAWIGWFWVGLASGVPLVALASGAALARAEPAWADAARLAGASRRTIWRQLVWPVIRPSAARAAGAVFTLTLVEPGAPLLLGLRRTLAFQLVEAALGPDPAPRAALLALTALGLAVAGQVLLGWWGGPPVPRPSEAPTARPEPARGPRAAVWGLVAGGWALVAWLPTLAVFARAGGTPPGGGGRRPLAALRGALADPIAARLILNAAALGLAVVAIDLALAWTVSAWAGRRRERVAALAAWPDRFPPLALGVGALVLPGLLGLGADALRAAHAPGRVVHGLQVLAQDLDPVRPPGILLALAVAAVRLPYLARTIEAGRGLSRPVLTEAAITLGGAPRAARRMASGRLGGSRGAIVLTFALAATDLAPALLLAPTAEGRPLAPGLLILADEPGDGLSRASALASLAAVVNLAALALAARRRIGTLGERFHG